MQRFIAAPRPALGGPAPPRAMSGCVAACGGLGGLPAAPKSPHAAGSRKDELVDGVQHGAGALPQGAQMR